MENYKAIPEGYMRIGNLAKQAGVTVRTLQYYDKEGLLSPSAESDGGFRLYNDKDMAKLFQILMMKDVGLSLKEIKERLGSLDSPADVINALSSHAAGLRSNIENLTTSLNDIETLKDEIAQMDVVDFKKYAAILANLQMKNKNYWMIKYLDNDTIDYLSQHTNVETADKLMAAYNKFSDMAAEYAKKGILPESKQGQAYAKELWELMLQVSNGNIELLLKISNQTRKGSTDKNWDESFVKSHTFMEKALEFFLVNDYNRNQPHKTLASNQIDCLLKPLEIHGAKAAQLLESGFQPNSPETQAFAKEFWKTMVEVCGGDYRLMLELAEQANNTARKDQEHVDSFIKEALQIYLNSGGSNQ
ncbi:MAG: MerR family transcriptional regulator [Defluviitaleaceae bacterium]|nr:MerR family transcriptional regulator [Defluviitaleaceae bacterium]